MLIKTGHNSLKVSTRLLETKEAWLWVGFGFGPKDNDDERVRKTRELMEQYYPYVPYGMQVGNKREDGTMTAITDTDDDGYYDVDVSWWPAGAYRFNLHTEAGQAAPNGSPLRPEMRDQECSWARLEADEYADSLRPFLHHEENGAGLSLRILIRPDRTIEPFGDA